jgi:hypothetical protein
MASPKTNSPTDTDLTREQLETAVRTLVSMASCWLDRDPEPRGIDALQSKRLRLVVETLARAATEQQVQVRRILASLYRDEIALALGSTMNTDPKDGNYLEDRARRYPNLPRQVLAEWAFTYAGYDDPDPVVTALRAGYFNFTLLGEGEGQNITIEIAHEYAAHLRKLAKDGYGAGQAASSVVVEILQEQTIFGDAEWTIAAARGESGGSNEDTKIKTAEKRMNRTLRETRHPDRLPLPDAVDLGEFFGARKSRSVGLDPREAAATDLIAAAAGLQRSADGAFRPTRDGWPGRWVAAARGHVSSSRPGKL